MSRFISFGRLKEKSTLIGLTLIAKVLFLVTGIDILLSSYHINLIAVSSTSPGRGLSDTSDGQVAVDELLLICRIQPGPVPLTYRSGPVQGRIPPRENSI